MSSHAFYNQVGLAYSDRMFNQRRWYNPYFYSGRHAHSLKERVLMALLTLATLMVPLLKVGLWIIDLPLSMKRKWRKIVEVLSLLSMIVAIIAYLLT